MALAEVKALFDILIKLAESAVKASDRYNKASYEIKSFPQKVEELKRKLKEWESLLESIPLPPGHTLLQRLATAKELLEHEDQRFQSLVQSSCCFTVKKLTFPAEIVVSLNDAIQAVDNILGGLRSYVEMVQLLQQEANNRIAPFSFFRDDKYEPIAESLDAVRKALEIDASSTSGTLVLLHGESGEGKSTLVKYLAWECQDRVKKGDGNFTGGIYFFACGNQASLFLLLKQLWEELGLGSYASEPTHSDNSPQVAQEADILRRKLVAQLELRSSKTMLMILDDVRDKGVAAALRFPYKHVVQLVTSQNSDLFPPGDEAKVVKIGKPSMEEAQRILWKHIGSWNPNQIIDPKVQVEVELLVKQVDFNPLVLANVAAVITDYAEDPTSDSDAWKKLSKDLYALLNHMHEADTGTRKPSAFNEPYMQTVGAALTLAFDFFSPEARSLILLLAICPASKMDEVVLKVWFKKLFGRSTINASRALLKKRSFIMFEPESEWTQESRTRWSIHDLRRRFLLELRESEVADLIQRLLDNQHQGEDDDLVAALCVLYGDANTYKQVLSKSQVWERFQVKMVEDPWAWPIMADFLKAFAVLLHPESKEEKQQRTHKLAKQVILHYLQRGEVLDEVVSQLLQIPESALPTCSALQALPHWWVTGYHSTQDLPLPKTIKTLAKAMSLKTQNLPLYLRAFNRCISRTETQTLRIVPDLPNTILHLLQQSPDSRISSELLKILASLAQSENDGTKLTSTSNLLETLVTFLDKDTYPDIFELSCQAIVELVRWDDDINRSLIAIPRTLQKVASLLPFTASATECLYRLAQTPLIAQQILSTPEVLNCLVNIIPDVNRYKMFTRDPDEFNSKNALNVLSKLASTRANRKLICTVPNALERILGLVTEDVLTRFSTTEASGMNYMMFSVADAVIKITDGGNEGGHEFQTFLVAAFQKCMALLEDGVDPNFQQAAAKALSVLASREAVRKSLIHSFPEVGNQLIRLIERDTTGKLFMEVSDFLSMVVEGWKIEDGNAQARMASAWQPHMTFLADTADLRVQEKVLKRLSELTSERATRRSLILSYPKVGIDLVRLMKQDTTASRLRAVSDVFYNTIIVDGPKMEVEGVRRLVAAALEKYMTFLAEDVDLYVQDEAVRALTELVSKEVIRTSLMQSYPSLSDDLIRLVRKDATWSPYVVLYFRVLDLFCTIFLQGQQEARSKNTKALVLAISEKCMTFLADDVDRRTCQNMLAGLSNLASRDTTCKTLMQSYPEVGDKLLRLMDTSPSLLEEVSRAFYVIFVKGTKMDGGQAQAWVASAFEKYSSFLAEDVGPDIQVRAVAAISQLASEEVISKSLIHFYPDVGDRLVRLMRTEINSRLLKNVFDAFYTIVVKRRKSIPEDAHNEALMASVWKKYKTFLADDVDPHIQEVAVQALSKLASRGAIYKSLIHSYPKVGEDLVMMIKEDATKKLLRNVSDALYVIVLKRLTTGPSESTSQVIYQQWDEKAQALVASALGKYMTLFTDSDIHVRIKGAVVQALSKLASCEVIRKSLIHFYPEVGDKLVKLMQEEVDWMDLEGVSNAIKLYFIIVRRSRSDTDVMKRTYTILFLVMGRYFELLEVDAYRWRKPYALQAIAEDCDKHAVQRLIVAVLDAFNRLPGLLNGRQHEDIVYGIVEVTQCLTARGTDLGEKATFAFLLNVVKHFMNLLEEGDTLEWSFLKVRLTALRKLALFPIIRKMILFYPGTQQHLVNFLLDDAIPPSVFVSINLLRQIISFKGPDLDERITVSFLSSSLKSYLEAPTNDNDLSQTNQRVAAKMQEYLTSDGVTSEPVMNFELDTPNRLVRFLDTNASCVDLHDLAFYLDLVHNLIPFNPSLVELRFTALNNFVALLERSDLSQLKLEETCQAISHLIQSSPDCSLLLSACPSVKERLLGMFEQSEDAAVEEDFESQHVGSRRSGNERVHCTYLAIKALTLMEPSSAVQVVLSSSEAYRGRGEAEVIMGDYESALLTYNRALELRPGSALLLSRRAYVRAQLSDHLGAKNDLFQAIDIAPDMAFYRAEIGILNQIMGNRHDSLLDLDQALGLIDTPIQFSDTFYILKHRGFVNYLLGEEEKARIDAEKALLVKNVKQHIYISKVFFGALEVDYLGFKM